MLSTSTAIPTKMKTLPFIVCLALTTSAAAQPWPGPVAQRPEPLPTSRYLAETFCQAAPKTVFKLVDRGAVLKEYPCASMSAWIDVAYPPPPPPPPAPPMMLEARKSESEAPSPIIEPVSPDVATDNIAVQQRLADVGFYRGKIDGKIGPASLAALSAYQRKNGLPVTHEVDQPTLAKIGLGRSPFATEFGVTNPLSAYCGLHTGAVLTIVDDAKNPLFHVICPKLK